MTTDSDHDLIEQLADEFLERRRRGETPSISEYCTRYPGQAKALRVMLGTVELMEDFPSDADSAATDSYQHHFDLDEIGGYRILREIGRGGMGVVYEAEHVGLGRRVALKVLPSHASTSQSARARFEREARAAAKMHHTNIVPVFEVGHDKDFSFYAMQLIEGQSLDRLIDEIRKAGTGSKADKLRTSPSGPKSSEKSGSSSTSGATQIGRLDGSGSGSNRHQFYRAVARIGLQAAQALEYAHARGIIHRDVKPSNLIQDESGVVWLTDFGLAKTDDDGLTQTGEYLGTLRYMAPELFQGVAEARSDIYALGLTLYELLLQRPTFASTDRLKIIGLIKDSDPPRPRAVDPRIPRDLETIVLKSIEKEPRARYATANALVDDLQRFVNDLPIKARRHSLPERLVRWSRRNKRLAAALAAIAALLVVVAVGSTLNTIHADALRKKAETAQQTAESAQQTAEARGEELEELAKTLERDLYFSHMNLAGQAAEENYGSETIRSRLNQWLPEPGSKDLRGWEWYYLYSLVHQASFASERQPGWIWEVDFSPDGDEVGHVVNAWGFQIRDAQSGKVLRQKRLGSCRCIKFSPDGRRIATGDFSGDIYIWDANSLEAVHEILSEDESVVQGIDWSPDGTKLVSCRTQPEFTVWDADTGERISSHFRDGTADTKVVCFSPNGGRIATITADENLRIWDMESGEQVIEFKHGSGPGGWLAWSPDGSKLASSLGIWDVDAQKLIASLSTLSVSWHPHSPLIACGGGDGVVRLFDVESSSVIREFHGHSERVWSVDWNQDGTQLVSSGLDNTVRIWDMQSPNQTQQITLTHETYSLDWNDTGTEIAIPTGWNFVSILDPVLRKVRQQHFDSAEAPDSPIDVAVYGPDGLLAMNGRMPDVYIWDRNSDRITKCDGGFESRGGLKWSSNGRLAMSSTRGILLVWDRNGKRLVGPKSVHNGSFSNHWHPDMERLITGGMDGAIRVWNAETWELEFEWDAGAPVQNAAISHEGAQLATIHRGFGVIWDLASGSKTKTLNEISEHFVGVDWSRDDSRLAISGNSSVSVWDVESARVALRFPMSGLGVRWSPDGRRLAATGPGSVHIWDATPGYEANK